MYDEMKLNYIKFVFITKLTFVSSICGVVYGGMRLFVCFFKNELRDNILMFLLQLNITEHYFCTQNGKVFLCCCCFMIVSFSLSLFILSYILIQVIYYIL